jgi:hypothetical protein
MNITNIINLIRAYFIENKRKLLIQCFCVFGIAIFGFSITDPQLIPVIIFFIFLGIAGSFFQSSLKKNNSTHFFTLPANYTEKFIYAVITLIIVAIVFQMLAIAGAYIGFRCFRPLFWTNIYTLDDFGFWSIIVARPKAYLYLAVTVLAFLFGSIYFKRKAFLKTLSIGLGFLSVMAILFLILLRIVFFDLRNNDIELYNSLNINLEPLFSSNYYYILPIALIVFFLSLTYLRLKETEV